MMAIMLDSHFKFLRVVENLLGRGNAILLAIEYDARIVIPLLMVWFEQLIPYIVVDASIATITFDVGEDFEKNMFHVGASIKES